MGKKVLVYNNSSVKDRICYLALLESRYCPAVQLRRPCSMFATVSRLKREISIVRMSVIKETGHMIGIITLKQHTMVKQFPIKRYW